MEHRIRFFGLVIWTVTYLGPICSAVGLASNDDISTEFVGDSLLQEENQSRFVLNQADALVGSYNQTEFCQGMYMTMFMDGFHWTMLLPRGHPSSQCLNYFVASWKLENPSQFHGALLFSFLLALLLEGLSKARTLCIRYFVGLELDRRSRTSELRLNEFLQQLCLTIIYGLQAVLGYLLMFIVMSYSIELMTSVIAGLIVGNRLWMPHTDDKDEDTNERPSSPPSRNLRDPEDNHKHPIRHPSLLPASMHTRSIRKRT
jgi:Ctr copper transporter family